MALTFYAPSVGYTAEHGVPAIGSGPPIDFRIAYDQAVEFVRDDVGDQSLDFSDPDQAVIATFEGDRYGVASFATISSGPKAGTQVAWSVSMTKNYDRWKVGNIRYE